MMPTLNNNPYENDQKHVSEGMQTPFVHYTYCPSNDVGGVTGYRCASVTLLMSIIHN